MVRRSTVATLALVGLCMAGFSTPAAYPQPVAEGGGGGRFFTGSHRDAVGCASCHDSESAFDVQLEGLPSEYRPGATYTVLVRWPDTDRPVSIVAEWMDAYGDPRGTVRLPPAEVVEDEDRCSSGSVAAALYETDDGREIIGMPACGARQLRLQWTAPDDENDDVTFFLGAVASDQSDDPTGDLVTMRETVVHGSRNPGAGCRTGGPPHALLLLLLWAFARRRGERPLVVRAWVSTRPV